MISSRACDREEESCVWIAQSDGKGRKKEHTSSSRDGRESVGQEKKPAELIHAGGKKKCVPTKKKKKRNV